MSRLVFNVIFLFVLSLLNISATPPYRVRNVGDVQFEADERNYRLPNNTKPEAYVVYISTDVAVGKFEFYGSVKIAIRVLQNTNNITLHQRQLKILAAQLMAEGGRNIPTFTPHFDSNTEFLTISTVNETLQNGSKVVLKLKYQGNLRKDAAGFYRSSYINAEGKRVWLATTQFESTDARHAFPCYDEPALKATFDIRLEHNSNYTAISNMPQAKKSVFGSRTRTYFEQTPPTSTYLIAFVISDFPFKEKINENGFKYRVFAEPNQIEKALFAIEESEKLLNAISQYLQVNYTLPKMDQAAIPDFAAGAMENWGLVTYQEPYLLYDEKGGSYQSKTGVVTTIAHEFGHQWFGNLVSPMWWNFLWLNEGFATLFSNIGADIVHPDWKIFESFVVEKLQKILKYDARNKTRPMTFYVENPSAIQALFDNIAYTKSGSVLRMFMHAFKEESFRKGINYYLDARAYNSATEDDLFDNLDRAVKEDKNLANNLNVNDIFSSWSNQFGFPLLTVTRNYRDNTINISQERYFDYYPHPDANLTTWWIPYNFDTANNVAVNDTSTNGWLPKGTKSMLIKSDGRKKWTNKDWVLFNKQQTGFYRVLYDSENYALIAKELNSGNINRIHPISRAQLIDDVKDFFLTGRIQSESFFALVSYIKRETEYAPWASAMSSFMDIKRRLMEGTEAYQKYIEFVAELVKPFYKQNGLDINETDSYVKSAKRNIAIKLACEFGIISCLQNTKQLLEKSIQSGQFTSQNTRGLIYEYGIHEANSSLIDSIWKRLSSIKNHQERQEILLSFGNIANETIRDEYLLKSFDSKINLNNIDRESLFIAIAKRSQGVFLPAFNLLKDKLETACKCLENIQTKNEKDQFLPIIKTIKEENRLTEQQCKHIDEKINDAMETYTVSRKIIEESVLELA